MSYVHAPVGTCIYCGASDCELTDEHIIPLGLAGADILPQASCKPCARITGKFEGVVQRTIFGDLRIYFNLPTRRKKERPKTKKITSISPDGSSREVEVPSTEYPPVMWVYTFGRCGFLLGAPPHLDVSTWNIRTIHDDAQLSSFIEKYGWDRATRIRFMPNEFRRMIAKIGYSFFVALAGYGEFEPLVLRAITDDGFNISYLVGQNPEWEEPVLQGGMHALRLRTLHGPKDQVIYVVEVRLFQSNATPTYHVVVGQTRGREQFNHVIKNIVQSGCAEIIESDLPERA
jgi:hypothetical protein